MNDKFSIFFKLLISITGKMALGFFLLILLFSFLMCFILLIEKFGFYLFVIFFASILCYKIGDFMTKNY